MSSLLSSISSHVYLDFWILSLVELPLHIPALRFIVDNLIYCPSRLLGEALFKSLPLDKVPSDYLARPKKLQHTCRLLDELFTNQLHTLIVNCLTARDASILYCLPGKGVGAWLNAILLSKVLHSNPAIFAWRHL